MTWNSELPRLARLIHRLVYCFFECIFQYRHKKPKLTLKFCNMFIICFFLLFTKAYWKSKFWLHWIPTRKDLGPTKYPRENILYPRNSQEKIFWTQINRAVCFWLDSLFMNKLLKSNGMISISLLTTLHKKWSFPWGNSSVNVTTSVVSYGFGHIYWRNP